MGKEFPHFLYDLALSFYDNLANGPFGLNDEPPYENQGEPEYDFFGTKVFAPFGIAAGPLPKSPFVKAALDRGFDIVTFKSVRTREYPCHLAPNILLLKAQQLDPGNLEQTFHVTREFSRPLTLANSFGIPSYNPEVWQPEIKKSFQLLKKGQAMLVAFQGTDRGEGHDAFVRDHVQGVKLLVQTGAKTIEINTSCPNEGSNRLLCFNPDAVREIITAIRAEVGDTINLIVKITFFKDDRELGAFIEKVGPIVQGITAINTIAAEVLDDKGQQAFPGPAIRMRPGISGNAIKHLALDMVKRLHAHREALGGDFKIIGVGGVQSPEDFQAMRAAGADFVMGLTGAIWNPNLAAEIKKKL